jgi:hypothetical protein
MEESQVSESTFLTTEELSARIKYDPRTIRERLVGADPNLSHLADRILSQGWKPTLSWSAVDKCRS